MTICVSIKVNDCLVFAADSASSLMSQDASGRPIIHNVYRHGNKVFNLFRSLPICAMTSGMGNIGNSSISTVAKDLRLLLQSDKKIKINPKNYTMEEVVTKSKEYIFDNLFLSLNPQPVPPHTLEFFVGGYGSGMEHAEVWQIKIQDNKCPDPVCVQGVDECGISWSGQPEALNRLVMGYSPKLPNILVGSGLSQQDTENLMRAIQSDPSKQLVSPAMPVQDAILLADFLVETTKGYVRFLPGADTVGGDTDIATVTKHEGFKWIRRKHYYPADLNLLETDHA